MCAHACTVHACGYGCIYALCLYPCTKKIEWITAFQLENPPQLLLHFTLIGIRLWKGILLCALSVFSATVISNYFSWSMTSDNNIFFPYSWPNSQSLLHIISVLFARVWGFLCVNLPMCVCTSVSRCMCVIFWLCASVCVCVFSRIHKHYVLLSLSSSAESQQATGDKTSLVAHNNHCDHSEGSMHSSD